MRTRRRVNGIRHRGLIPNVRGRILCLGLKNNKRRTPDDLNLYLEPDLLVGCICNTLRTLHTKPRPVVESVEPCVDVTAITGFCGQVAIDHIVVGAIDTILYRLSL